MISKILSSIYDAFNNSLPGKIWYPSSAGGKLTTFCNFAVNSILTDMGYTKFNAGVNQPISANAMVKSMSDPSGDWMIISGDVAQHHANSGAIVIAGQLNVLGHGHVCIVIPGELKDSGNYVKKVPVVMNVGKDVFIGKPVSFSFQMEPSYFVLKSTVPTP